MDLQKQQELETLVFKLAEAVAELQRHVIHNRMMIVHFNFIRFVWIRLMLSKQIGNFGTRKIRKVVLLI
jgi:hypothetical protein